MLAMAEAIRDDQAAATARARLASAEPAPTEDAAMKAALLIASDFVGPASGRGSSRGEALAAGRCQKTVVQ
jgi:hypothetical protein